MAVREIGARITADSTQFQKEMSAVNSNLSGIKAEMKAVTAEFDGNSNSAAALTAQNKLLAEQQQQTKVKVDALRSAYDEVAATLPGLAAAAEKAAAEFGVNSKEATAAQKAYNGAQVQADKLAKQLSNARADYAKATSALKENNAALNAHGPLYARVASSVSRGRIALQNWVEGVRDSAAQTPVLGDAMKLAEVGAKAAGTALQAAGSAAKGAGKLFVEGSEIVAKGTAAMATGALVATGALATLGVSGLKTLTQYAVEAANAKDDKGKPVYSQYADLADNLTALDAATSRAKAALGGVLLPMLQGLSAEGTQYLTDFSAAMEAAEGDTEKMGQVMGEYVAKGVDLISAHLPEYISMGKQLLTSLGSGVQKNLPEILSGTEEIMLTMLDGLRESAPMLGSAGLEIVMMLLDFILSSAPELLPAGLDLITQVIEGLSEAGPDLNAAAMEIVTALLGYLIANGPELLTAGVQLLTQVISGISADIPQLIPVAITAVQTLLSSLISNAPQLLLAALQLILALVSGLLENIPQLLEAGKELILQLLSALLGSADDLVSVGSEAVNKIKEGFSNAWDALVSFATGLWEGLKSIFSGGIDVDIRGNASGLGGGSVGQYATGLDYVPYDNFPAYLHKGEAVLTATEAAAWRHGQGAGNVVNLAVYAQDLSDSQIAYLVRVINEELGKDVA